ncbi:MAG: sulfate transporter CysZ [Halorhodospira sp.]
MIGPARNPLAGLRYFLRGFRLVLVPGVKRYVVAPLLINVVLFAGALIAGAMGVQQLAAWLQATVPGWLDWLAWLLWPLYIVAGLLVVFYTASLVANLVAAPFMEPLAAAVERHLRGTPPPQESAAPLRALAGVPAAVGTELYKLAYFITRALPLLVLSAIPGANAVAPLLWLLFGAWMLAREYLEPPLANRGLGFRQQGAALRGYRLPALGFGAAATVTNTIPVLNFLILPVAVAGGTALVVEGMDDRAEAG